MNTNKGSEYPKKKIFRSTHSKQNITESTNNNSWWKTFKEKLTNNKSESTNNNSWEKFLENSPLALFLALTPVIISLTNLYVADQQSKEKTLTEYVEFVKSLFFDVYYSDSKKPRIPSVSISNFVSSKTVNTLKIFEKSKEQGKLLNFLKQAKIGFLPSSDELLDPKSMDIPKEIIDTVKYSIECSLDYDKQPKEAHPRINNSCLLTGINLAKINLNGQDLRFIVLKKAQLLGTQLNGTDLSKAILMEADLSKAQLNKAFLRETDLTSANLQGVKMIEAKLGNAILNNANFGSVDVDSRPDERTDLRRADLSKAKLVKAKLSGVDLRGANLSEADLRGANLSEADLRGADLSEADLRGADLRGADLRKLEIASLSNYVFNSKEKTVDADKLSNYKDLEITQFKWIDKLDIVPFNVTSSLLYLELKITNLSNTDLRNANLRETRLDGVNLYRSNLQGAKLYEKSKEPIDKSLIFRRLWQHIQFYEYDLKRYEDKLEILKVKKTLCQTILPEREIAEPSCQLKQ